MNLVFHEVKITDKRRIVLQHLSFAVKPGTVTAVVGPSRSGKSSLLLAAGGYLPLTDGYIGLVEEQTTAGQSLDLSRWKKPTWREVGIGPIPGYSPLFDTLTVREHLVFHGRLHKQKMSRKRVDELLECYELVDVQRMRIKDLDAFAYFRASLAITALPDPAFVLLDEPMAGLTDDEWQRGQIYFQQWTESGRGVLFTTVLSFAAAAADSVVYLPSGEVVSANEQHMVHSSP